jgi:flagellar basal body-associated protein FliL
MDKGPADPPDRKARLIVIIIALLTVTSAITLTVAWFVLIGYGVLALVGWTAG